VRYIYKRLDLLNKIVDSLPHIFPASAAPIPGTVDYLKASTSCSTYCEVSHAVFLLHAQSQNCPCAIPRNTSLVTFKNITAVMSTDLQDKKFHYVFRWFDQNADGYLTQDDMENVTKLFHSMAEESDEKNKELLKNAFMNWWKLLYEARKDKASEKIDEEEFIRIMHDVVIAPGNFEVVIVYMVDGLIGVLDLDHNGSLSLEEYLGMYKALGLPSTTASEAFKKLDLDGNGEISHEEFNTALHEYYLSNDPKAPGNWLLGPPFQ
jgi:Ca2+-binding EF-hand superfamily protein